MFSKGSTVCGESGSVYRLVDALGTRRGTTTPNVWQVVEEPDGPEFVAKGPSRDDDEALNWPAFQHEAKMQRLFTDDPMLRRMVDFVPKTNDMKPMMILEPFQKTLWASRTTRPFSTKEIKWIMKGVLLGIMTVHRKGLVYTGSARRYLPARTQY
jgi:serine/threonine protein kinase